MLEGVSVVELFPGVVAYPRPVSLEGRHDPQGVDGGIPPPKLEYTKGRPLVEVLK